MTNHVPDFSDLRTTNSVCKLLKILKEEQLPLSPAEIKSPSRHATAHVLVACISPIKPSRYFDAKLTDGDFIIGIVGFVRAKAHSTVYCSTSATNDSRIEYPRVGENNTILRKKYPHVKNIRADEISSDIVPNTGFP